MHAALEAQESTAADMDSPLLKAVLEDAQVHEALRLPRMLQGVFFFFCNAHRVCLSMVCGVSLVSSVCLPLCLFASATVPSCRAAYLV